MGAGGSKDEETFKNTVLSEIPDEVRGQIEQHIKDQKDKYEQLRVSSSQKYFELEKQLIETQGDLNVQTDLASRLKEQVTDLETKYVRATQDLRDIQQADLEHGKQRDSLVREKHNLVQEKRDLSDLVDTKNKEIDRLQEEWRQMSLRVNEANKTKIEAMQQKDEAQADLVKIEHQVNRLQQEKEMMSQQVTWLEASLKEKTANLLNNRKDNASRSLELQAELEQKQTELTHALEQLQHAREAGEKSRESNEQYISKLEEMTNVQTYRDEQFRTQLNTQEKLIHLYKTSAAEAEKRCKDFQHGAEEVQKLLDEAIKAKEEIEDLRREDSARFEATVQAKDTAIEKLETELKNANEFLEAARKRGVATLSEQDLEEISPSAAAASKLLKSGMTLTQIYSEYVQVSEKLLLEEQENKRLSENLEAIVAEIEEKAPILKQQREEYERGLETIDLLTNQLDNAVKEAERRQIHFDETNRHCNELARENHRLKQQCMDLGTQVRMLLKELEQARGTLVSHSDDDVIPRSSSSAQSVISEKLVTFKSIEELQEQNQKLLNVVRELSEAQEKDEQANIDTHTAEITKKLEAAMEEMEEMRASRERQVQLMQAIVRQRDMYKALLSQPQPEQEMELTGGVSMVTSTPGGPSATSYPETPVSSKTPVQTPRSASKSPGVDRTLYEETKSKLREMQDEFNTYRREKGENEKMLNEEIDRLRSECSEQRINAAKLSTQLTYAEERYKTVHSNIEKYKLEIAALTDKNSKYSASIVKHEQTIAMLREDLMANQEKLTRAEVTCDRLTQQCETLRTMEARMSQEKESVLREQRSQNLLLSSLQAIQNNLERSEFETRTMLNNRIEQLEKENVLVKRKLEQAQDHQRSHIQSLERQLIEAKDLLGTEDMEHRKTSTDLRLAREQVRTLETQVAKLEAQVKAMKEREEEGPAPVISSQQAVNSEQLRTAQSQLQQARTNISNLTEQLAKARRHAEEFKAISETMEKNLGQNVQASKELQEKLERELKEAQDAQAEAVKQRDASEGEKQKLINENIRLTAEIKKSNVGLRQQLESLQTELTEAVARREAAISNEQKAIADLNEQVKRANEAQDKYQHELMLHAADVSSLTQVKEELEGFTSKLHAAEMKAQDATERLNMEKVSWNEQKKLMGEDRSRLQERITELQQQNELLHSNLNELGDKMAGIQNRKAEEDRDTKALAERVAREPTDKSSEQLLEVIKFLRKEKDIAEAKLSVVETESARYKHEAETTKKQLLEANASIEREREKAQVTVQTAAQHSDLLRKVENLNILQESNRMMREEKDGLTRQVREMEAKIQQLQADIQPLQAAKRDLETQNETLGIEAQALKEEIERWKARTNRLIEERIDPQEHKAAQEELVNARKSLASKTEELMKTRAELSQISKQLADIRSEAAAANGKVAEQNTELQRLRTEAESKDKEGEEKAKTITQLRNIGRKYRKQAEDTQKEIDALKKQHEETLKVNVPEMQNKLKASEDKLKAVEEQLRASEAAVKTVEGSNKVKDDQLKSLEEERNNVLGRLGTSETEKTELLKKMVAMETEMGQKNEQQQKMQEELVKARSLETELKAQKEDLEKKNETNRKIVLGAKSKLLSQKTEIDNLKKENDELKGRVAGASQSSVDESDQRLKAVRSQYENQLTQLRSEVESSKNQQQILQGERDSLKQELENTGKRLNEMAQRNNQLQKLLEVYKSQISVTSTAQKAQASPMTAASDSPKTVSIRPMTAPTSTTQVRPQQGQSMRSISETRAMASIRPMAVSTPVTTATSTPQQPSATTSGQTPTATVHPTTQDSDVTMPLQVVTSARPTQPVQAVSPHVEEREQSNSDEMTTSSTQEPSSTSPAVSVTPSAAPSTSVSSSTPVSQLTQEVVPSTSGGGSGVGSSMGSVFGSKRPRDDGEGQSTSTDSDHAPLKKSKTAESPAGEVSQSADSVEGAQQSEPGTSAASPEVDLTQGDDQDGAIINVDDAEQSEAITLDDSVVEASDNVDDSSADYADDGEGAEMGEEEEEEEEYGYEDGDEPVVELFAPEDEDDCVVIVEDDEADAAQPSTQTPPSHPTSHSAQQSTTQQLEAQSSSSTVASQLSSSSSLDSQNRVVPQFGAVGAGGMGRGAARSQLQPFIIGGEHGHVDLGDDGCVPSTPTLFVPKRSDGFAEAISSPAVSRQFVFSQGTGPDAGHSQPDFGQLASQGGLDNPFIDLAQLEGQQQQPMQFSVTSSNTTTQQGEADSETSSAQDTQQQIVGSTSSADAASQQATSSDASAISSARQVTQTQEAEVGQGEGGAQVESELSSRDSGDKSVDSQDRADADSAKPKIEPIVWDDGPSTSSPAAGQALARQQNVPRYQSPQHYASPTPMQGNPIGTVGVPNYSQQQFQQMGQPKRFPSQGMRRGGNTAFRSRPTAFRSRPRGGRGVGTPGSNQQQQQQNMARGARGSRGTKGGPFRQQPF